MFLTTNSRTVNEFNRNVINLLITRINQITAELGLEPNFGLAIWDYSYIANELVQLIGAHLLENGSYLADLERAFPALSGRAKKLFERASREERFGISPIDLIGGCSFVIIMTPNNLMLFGVKTESLDLNHSVIEEVIEAIADIREGVSLPLLSAQKTSNNYLLAASS
ncbi:hypothetical protein IKF03_00810 [Candidatus Saccharibacteria bacterium]|nr:hypothetical protein [Candidatus Saccharibacteria bacterium]